jgi:hypothetical protein
MEATRTDSPNPKDHIRLFKAQLDDLISHLREDISKVEDRQAKALFEVSAEVLLGLQKAFNDYEKKNEEAWKK